MVILGKIHMRLHPCRDGIYSSFWPKEIVIPTKIHLVVVSGVVYSGMLIRIFLPESASYIGATFAIIDPIVTSISGFLYTPLRLLSEGFQRRRKVA